MPYLVQLGEGGGVLKTWELGDERITFGRGEAAHETIDDQELSREHFAITRVGGIHVITDLKSTNGTRVNGIKVSAHDLHGNDQIKAGQTRFFYQVGTSTMLGMAEEAMGAKFKDQLKNIYNKAGG